MAFHQVKCREVLLAGKCRSDGIDSNACMHPQPCRTCMTGGFEFRKTAGTYHCDIDPFLNIPSRLVVVRKVGIPSWYLGFTSKS